MISTASEYKIALKQLTGLESRLARLQAENAAGAKGYTKAGVRKMLRKFTRSLLSTRPPQMQHRLRGNRRIADVTLQVKLPAVGQNLKSGQAMQKFKIDPKAYS